MESGIYKITNNLNNHFYIGQSKNIKKRWYSHKKNAEVVKNHYTVLEKAFHKYGIKNFSFEVLEKCEIDKLDEREIFYIDTLKPEYNMNLGGSGNTGYVVTDETKKILHELGCKQWNSYDEETKKNIIRNQLTGPRKGSHRSEETKKILSEKTKAYFEKNNGMSQEQKEKISNALKNKKRPNLKKYKPVVAIYDNGMKFYFTSIKYAAIILDIDRSEIGHCLRGDRKKAGGYFWNYCSQEAIHNWSRGELITSRSAIHPENQDEDIVHTIAKNESYGEYDKGLIELARRSNTIKTIAAEPIHENDIIDIELGMNRHLSHKIDIFKERGEVIGYYCLVELNNGGCQFTVSSKKDIEQHRDKFSKAYKKDDKTNVWNTNFDAMALKTQVIKTLKLCPISIAALDAIAKEEITETIADENDYSIVDEPAETPKIEEPKVVAKPEIESPKNIPSQFEENNSLTPDEESLADEAFSAASEAFDGDVF